MEPIKIAWDELTHVLREEAMQAIEKHREVESREEERQLGFPFAYWPAWFGENACPGFFVEFFDLETKQITCYQYQRQVDGWHWRKRESNDNILP